MLIRPFWGGFLHRIFISPSGIVENAPSHLDIPTYDGKNQCTHPDVIEFTEPWQCYKYWMVMTPYPDYNQRYENPSVVASNDGRSWEVPPGLTNPIVPAPLPEQDYHNDPEIVYHDVYNELWIYYQLVNSRDNQIEVKLTKSSDGAHWSKPINILNIPVFQWTSPSIIKQGNLFKVWTVNAGAEGRLGNGVIGTIKEYIEALYYMTRKMIPLRYGIPQPIERGTGILDM